MDTPTPTLFPADASAIQENRDLLRKFASALARNSAADLMALIPRSYSQRHVNVYMKSLESDAVRLNQRTLDDLQIVLREEPEVDLLAAFPSGYARRMKFAACSGKNPTGWVLRISENAPTLWRQPQLSCEKCSGCPKRYGKAPSEASSCSIFSGLRTLREDDVGGEEVKEPTANTSISTAAEFNYFKFSASHHGSNTYVKLLRAFPTGDMRGSVFTHGDIRVTGIIDWKDSGFYPEYHECTQLTRTMSVVDENDWYLYLPESVSPLNFPKHWLVDQLWSIHPTTT
ncbi:hypothetical protein N7492_008903 [Penicillium capsulatum]|uniref:Aminoglycoside phosphotransferase domain-containing protein n=1 Tax=Penicillium capsulatum TaxID=69766 RepID=A0A9W9LHR2_9EURO|nr:hypothetical protein N7492_008903 [Penicillium capsulatum]